VAKYAREQVGLGREMVVYAPLGGAEPPGDVIDRGGRIAALHEAQSRGAQYVGARIVQLEFAGALEHRSSRPRPPDIFAELR
jgi:hypothetical protein